VIQSVRESQPRSTT